MTIAVGNLDQTGAARPERGASVRCIVTNTCPAGWEADLLRCGAGFFHSPPGVEVGGPPGETVFLRIYSGNEVIGVGAGVRRRCRLSDTPRHVYLPTWPAIAPNHSREAVLTAIMDALQRFDAVELVIESFDSEWLADRGERPKPREIRERDEFVIPIDTPEQILFDSLASGHRRQVRRGEKSGWRVEESEGEAARALLVSVQQLAARRAASRGSGFVVRVPQLTTLDATARAWGATMFVAWQDDTPLAAALVGWANKRAFYVMGGSTDAGYECGASLWLHWRIARRLAGSGHVTYNLGGSARTAAAPGDPSHGLYRFKSGFGSRVVSCRSMSWLLNRAHGRVHQLGRWLSAPSPSVSET
jgi:hypothetical protein